MTVWPLVSFLSTSQVARMRNFNILASSPLVWDSLYRINLRRNMVTRDRWASVIFLRASSLQLLLIPYLSIPSVHRTTLAINPVIASPVSQQGAMRWCVVLDTASTLTSTATPPTHHLHLLLIDWWLQIIINNNIIKWDLLPSREIYNHHWLRYEEDKADVVPSTFIKFTATS